MTDKKTYSGRLEFEGVTRKEDAKKSVSKSKMGKPNGFALAMLGVEGGTLYLNAQTAGFFNNQTGEFQVGKNGRIISALNITITPEYADENPEIVAHMAAIKKGLAKKTK